MGYDCLMSKAENTIYGSYGEFQPVEMTDAEWAAYDAHIASEMEQWDADQAAEYEAYAAFDDFYGEPPF